MRAVLDTNVLVSAILSPTGPPDLILQAWRRGAFELITSAPLLMELRGVLGRPRIAKRLRRQPAEVATFLSDFSENALVVTPEEELHVVQRDPADNRVLEAAVAGKADFVVSGDEDLLALSYEGVSIVTPARFAAILAVSSERPPQ